MLLVHVRRTAKLAYIASNASICRYTHYDSLWPISHVACVCISVCACAFSVSTHVSVCVCVFGQFNATTRSPSNDRDWLTQRGLKLASLVSDSDSDSDSGSGSTRHTQ